VATDPRIAEFIEKALAAGIPHDSLVGVLAAHGWPEKEVYEALGNHYRRLTGIDIPRRAAAGASAKEAFFYLLIFSTLATWTIGFGCLALPSSIDGWLTRSSAVTSTPSIRTPSLRLWPRSWLRFRSTC
jgi:hypothetical protein